MTCTSPSGDLGIRVMIYRTRVGHESPRNFKLDLFTPDDGHFEYGAVATKLALDLPALYAFARGRGAQEKTFAGAQRGVCPRCRPHQALRRQQCLAATQRLGLQPDPQLPARHPGAGQAARPQADLRLSAPQHADSALPPDRPGRALDPHLRSQHPAALSQSTHGALVWNHRSTLGIDARAWPAPPVLGEARRGPSRPPSTSVCGGRRPSAAGGGTAPGACGA
jgi:hypothetical protein